MTISLDYFCCELQADIDVLKQAIEILDHEEELDSSKRDKAVSLIIARINKLEVRERLLRNY
ncbi:hypothetical protein [Veronia pacifica]|uniref:Uncharacterized protein n=1 Tax=Veronia pacifica TaxID=1080227 RepID=A0A1C3EPJ9_9GAMM|nr:hypothetical protein [Veronia pacifica]ODA35122.1 hypothetical protein A8L45_05440 [Veronia pacifica]